MPSLELINYGSGELELKQDNQPVLRLNREETNRLILMARMHSVEEFVELLPKHITEVPLLDVIRQKFSEAASPTIRWNLKEAFARLTTLTKGYESKNPNEVLEKVVI